ncbi:MAG: hypothetical protein JWP97_3748, partial [Labilithrix sp.]|nr:hypothetical protein [Labilithrix sp.]
MLRLYSETLSFAEIERADTLRLLRRHPFDLVLAVRPWQLEDLPEVVRTLEGAGVRTSVWPMLADHEGRWASAGNAASFARLLLATGEALARSGMPAREVLLDLEPPFTHARALAVGAGAEGRLREVAQARPRRPSREELGELVEGLVPELDGAECD